MKLSTQFDYTRLDHTQTNLANLVISLTAPEIDWIAQRPKVCVVPVLDISGSMLGQKLDYAKSSIRKLIEQLTPGDIAGFIVFSDRTTVVVPPALVTAEHKTKLLSAVDKTTCRGGTNLTDALLDSLKEVQDLDLPLGVLQRIILFTDGEPTVGLTDKTAIKESFSSARGRTTVSFFGYGVSAHSLHGTCDQTFLTELSQLGRGNYAYVQNPDDSLSAFGKELGGLLSTYASDIKLVVTPLHGHKITKVISDVPSEMDVLGELVLDLGDIFAEETRHVVLQTEIQSQPKALPREFKIFDVKVNFQQVTKGGKTSESVGGSAKVRFVRPKDSQKDPDTEVDEVIAIHQMVRSQLEAEEKAKQGFYSEAQQIMLNTSQDFKIRGRARAAHVAHQLSHRLGDALTYSSNQGYLRSMQYGGSRGMGVSGLTEEATQDLAGCNVSLNNSAQSNYVASFTTRVPHEPEVLDILRDAFNSGQSSD